MQTIITIPKNEYQDIIRRQFQIEKELKILKKAVLKSDENYIYSFALKKWERISNDLDQGKGRFFTSVKEMEKWLKNL